MQDRTCERALQVLDDMKKYLDTRKYSLFSSNSVTVERTAMEEYMQELRQIILQDQK